MTVIEATTRLSYALVTPARNERANLDRLAAAVRSQRLEPHAWIIVDDSSDDGTAEAAQELARRTPWITVVELPTPGGTLEAGRREGRALDAFVHGVNALPEPVDVVVKVDADTSFADAYFDGLVRCFEEDPTLGIAGGACYELQDGVWTRQKVVASHPRGASRAYRWACVDDVLTLEPRMGWDGLDEARAKLRGYRSASIVHLGFRHHRPTGGRERTRVRHQVAQGRAAWYMGYRPSYLLLRTGYRVLGDPSAVGMLLGYGSAAARRERRCPDRAAVRVLRDEQRLRATLRRGAPQ